MPPDNRSPTLYKLLRIHSAAALKILEQAIHDGAQPTYIQRGVWQKMPDHVYARQQITKPEYWTLFHRHKNAIEALPSFQQAVDAVRSDTVWGKHMDTQVGSASGSRRVELNTLINEFAYNSLKQTNSFDLSEECFNKLYITYEKLFSADEINHVRYTPVYGIYINETIAISDNISIAPLAEEDTIELISLGVITSDHFGMGSDFIHHTPKAAIYSYFSLPKVIGETSPEQVQRNLSALTDIWNQLNINETALLDMLTLILENPVTSLGSITKTIDSLDGARQIQKNPTANAWAIPNKEFTPAFQQKLHTLWPIVYGNSQKSRHFLAIGIRRYALAMSRPSLDDKLIDLMISAESIFLDTDKNELRFRLSHRVALLLGNTTEEKKELFNFMKKAYDMRSKVVHGSKSFQNAPHDVEALSQTIKSLAEIMQRSLLLMLEKALLPHAPKELIDWTEMMFPTQ